MSEQIGLDLRPRIKPGPSDQVPATAAIPDDNGAGHSYYKAMTLKLDRDRYIRLKNLGLAKNKTSQMLLIEALDLWLAENS